MKPTVAAVLFVTAAGCIDSTAQDDRDLLGGVDGTSVEATPSKEKDMPRPPVDYTPATAQVGRGHATGDLDINDGATAQVIDNKHGIDISTGDSAQIGTDPKRGLDLSIGG